MNNRYYANVQGADPDAILACLKKANEIIANDPDVEHIVLYSYTKNNFNTVAQIFGPENVLRMEKLPVRFRDLAKPVQCLTERTFNDWNQQSCIVICCHMDSKAVFKVDDFRTAKYIIALSWTLDGLDEWKKRWNAQNVLSEEEGSGEEKATETSLLKIALDEMDARMYGTKTMGNSDDIETCKTYIRVIHKYLPDASPSQVQNILVVELNWTSKDAAEVGELLQRLKDGGRFVGGQKTNLKEYYNRWKEKQ